MLRHPRSFNLMEVARQAGVLPSAACRSALPKPPTTHPPTTRLPRSFNMMEAARQTGVQRFFYASSACIYPEHKQLGTEVEGGGLKEDDAWPAQPQVGLGPRVCSGAGGAGCAKGVLVLAGRCRRGAHAGCSSQGRCTTGACRL